MGSIEEQFVSYWLASLGWHKTNAPRLHQQLAVFFLHFPTAPDAAGCPWTRETWITNVGQLMSDISFGTHTFESRTYLVFLIRPTIASTMQNLCYTVIQLHICHLWMCNGVTAGSRPIDVHLLQRRRSDPCHGDAIGTSGSGRKWSFLY